LKIVKRNRRKTP